MIVDNNAAEWYSIAKMDLTTAHHIFNTMHPKPLEIACYLAQQSAEKLLKGFLVSQGKDPPKTHNLVSLNDLCVVIWSGFEVLDDALADLNAYGVQPRYPQEIEITEEDAQQALISSDLIYAFFSEKFM